nr:uncharacterized protein LOC109194118 [Ipomoea batatas]
MAETHIEAVESEPENEATPLLLTEQTEIPENPEGKAANCTYPDDTHLAKALQRLELFLTLLGFNQSSVPRLVLSWGFFSVLALALPLPILQLSDCPACEAAQIKSFEIGIVISQACLAAAALLCLSHNLRKYGVRKFLFVDRYAGHEERFSQQYIHKISGSLHLLVLWVLPCFILKTAREVFRILYVHRESGWESAAILLAFVLSWTYVTVVFLSACVLFHLVCNLQIIHFDDYVKLLEREPDVSLLINEHVLLRYNLSKISHRFRMYLLLEFVIVTGSQFATLFQTTGYTGIITYVNSADFVVSSIVQVSGVILCLYAAAKISHRAESIGSLASTWHALATCSTDEASQIRYSTGMGNMEAANISSSFYMNSSESDLESGLFIVEPTNAQLASDMSSYHKREALVMYLQSNPGGITIFGYTVNRGLINTIFFIQLSLITFVLGMTLVF